MNGSSAWNILEHNPNIFIGARYCRGVAYCSLLGAASLRGYFLTAAEEHCSIVVWEHSDTVDGEHFCTPDSEFVLKHSDIAVLEQLCILDQKLNGTVVWEHFCISVLEHCCTVFWEHFCIALLQPFLEHFCIAVLEPICIFPLEHSYIVALEHCCTIFWEHICIAVL